MARRTATAKQVVSALPAAKAEAVAFAKTKFTPPPTAGGFCVPGARAGLTIGLMVFKESAENLSARGFTPQHLAEKELKFIELSFDWGHRSEINRAFLAHLADDCRKGGFEVELVELRNGKLVPDQRLYLYGDVISLLGLLESRGVLAPLKRQLLADKVNDAALNINLAFQSAAVMKTRIPSAGRVRVPRTPKKRGRNAQP